MEPAGRLSLTPQLQLAIRMLALAQEQLFAMVSSWLDEHPGVLVPLAADEPDVIGEAEWALSLEQGTAIWTFQLGTAGLPALEVQPEVWVIGAESRARANPAAFPRVRVADGLDAERARDGLWLARAIRQRARTMELIVNTLIDMTPALATSTSPGALAPVSLAEVARRTGLHQSTVTRVVPALRYQTNHGVTRLVVAGTSIAHAAI